MQKERTILISVTIMLSAISLLLFLQTFSLQQQLQTQNSISIQNLNTINRLQNEIDDLANAHLYASILNWTNTQTDSFNGHIEASCIVFNAGNLTARGAYADFTVYMKGGTILGSISNSQQWIGDLPSQSFKTFTYRTDYNGQNIEALTVQPKTSGN